MFETRPFPGSTCGWNIPPWWSVELKSLEDSTITTPFSQARSTASRMKVEYPRSAVVETTTAAPMSAAYSHAWARSSVRSSASAPALIGRTMHRGQIPADPSPLSVSAAACSIWPFAWPYSESTVAGSFWSL